MKLVYQKKISICLNRGSTESLSNDDVLALNNSEFKQLDGGGKRTAHLVRQA